MDDNQGKVVNLNLIFRKWLETSGFELKNVKEKIRLLKLVYFFPY